MHTHMYSKHITLHFSGVRCVCATATSSIYLRSICTHTHKSYALINLYVYKCSTVTGPQIIADRGVRFFKTSIGVKCLKKKTAEKFPFEEKKKVVAELLSCRHLPYVPN